MSTFVTGGRWLNESNELLPVAQIIAPLLACLDHSNCILVAPPGAGKSTYLPLQILKENVAEGQKIIMLQPRRMAVISIAHYLSEQLGEEVGNTIGYRIRGESKVSARTKLEIVTEGLLTRKLQSHPEMTDVGLVIFDEFHERSIHGDFSLALCLEVQQALRDDLRLIVMSATLQTEQVQQLLPDAEVLKCEGRSYPIDLNYRPFSKQQTLTQAVVQAVLNALKEQQGSILVFLPGAKEIKRIEEHLIQCCSKDIVICPLFGRLSKQQQLQAISPTEAGKTKVVLATNIAETSLTIDGISVVIDTGLENHAHFNLNNGITQLQQQKISKASSVQRAGRAGRLGPGFCYRLWSKEQQDRLLPQTIPEIKSADIAPLLLECLVWGTDFSQLELIDMPSSAQLANANILLAELGATCSLGKITSHGKKLNSFGTHPRVANMLLRAKEMGAEVMSLACTLAVLLEERDLLPKSDTSNIIPRLDYLLANRSHRYWQLIGQWQRKMQISKGITWPLEYCGVLMAFAYPDRIAKSRGNGRYQLLNGSGASMHQEDPMAQHPWLVAGQLVHLAKQQADASINLSAEISLEQIQQYFSHLTHQQQVCHWSEKEQQIEAHLLNKLGEISVSKETVKDIDEQNLLRIWTEVICKKGIEHLPLSEKTNTWLTRARLATRIAPELGWPDLSNDALASSIEAWLWPFINHMVSWKQMQTVDFDSALKAHMTWSQQQALEQLLPESMRVPSGNVYRLSYEDTKAVTLSVRMQEMYGSVSSPTIADGRITVTLELLSPARRPLQVTSDLAGFWQGSYKDVQKEMKGRYPKHYWPDDPAIAKATATTKRKMNL